MTAYMEIFSSLFVISQAASFPGRLAARFDQLGCRACCTPSTPGRLAARFDQLGCITCCTSPTAAAAGAPDLTVCRRIEKCGGASWCGSQPYLDSVHRSTDRSLMTFEPKLLPLVEDAIVDVSVSILLTTAVNTSPITTGKE